MNRRALTRWLNLGGMVLVGLVLVSSLSQGQGAPSIYIFMVVNFGLTYRILGSRPKWLRVAMFSNSAVALVGSALALALYRNHEQIGVEAEEMERYVTIAVASLCVVVLNVWALIETGIARMRETEAERLSNADADGDATPAPSDDDDPDRGR